MMHRFFAYDKKESVIRMFLPIAVVALLGFAFIGCAGKSSQRTGAFPVVEEDLQARSLVPSPSKSLVYCYDENFVMLWKYTIELDGVSSKIQGNSYLVWEVEPGKHTFKVTFDKIMSKDSFSTNIKTEGGRTYYYHLVAGKEQTASTGSYDAFRYNFDKVSEATGRKKIEDFSLM